MGLRQRPGPAGLLVVLAFAFLWGMAFAGYAAFVALRTKNARGGPGGHVRLLPADLPVGTRSCPSSTSPRAGSRWPPTINPTTYVFDAMRSLLITAGTRPLLVGFAVTLGFATLTGIMALWAARGATKLAS